MILMHVPKRTSGTCGEMSERFKEPVLKTGDAAMHRGFKSHSLRQAHFVKDALKSNAGCCFIPFAVSGIRITMSFLILLSFTYSERGEVCPLYR